MPETSQSNTPLVVAWLAQAQLLWRWIDGAVEQVPDGAFFAAPFPGGNSVAVILKHLSGNIRSRWTDWRTTDGEKPWRNREQEFDAAGSTRAEIESGLASAASLMLTELASIGEADLSRTITIRGEPHSVPMAVTRQLVHLGYHAGQIMLVARGHTGSEAWRWLTVPPGQSETFNGIMARKHGEFRR